MQLQPPPAPPAPTVMYPKSGAIWLLEENKRLAAHVHDLVNGCVEKDQKIAALEAELDTLRPAIPNVISLAPAL